MLTTRCLLTPVGRQFYLDYAAACDELGVAPLTHPELLALIETLAEWQAAMLH